MQGECLAQGQEQKSAGMKRPRFQYWKEKFADLGYGWELNSINRVNPVKEQRPPPRLGGFCFQKLLERCRFWNPLRRRLAGGSGAGVGGRGSRRRRGKMINWGIVGGGGCARIWLKRLLG